MVQWKTILFLLAISAAVAVFGCPANHSFFSFSRSAPSAASASGRSPTASSETKREKYVVARHVWSDSAFSVYRSQDFGISFRYPRNFALQEQSQASDSDAGVPGTAQSGSTPSDATAASASATDATASETPQAQELQSVGRAAPHLIATVSIPSDAYPNTTFEGGTLQFLAHPAAKAEACQPFATEPRSARDGTSGTVSIQGMAFAWRERSSVETETRHVRREYAGYSAGTCYDFYAEVDTYAKADQDDETTPVVTKRIMRTLEKIVLSLQLEPASASAPTKMTTQ